ncbi:N-methylproline demethylase [Leptolyngbya valderiana BDU 20041]|nr:N-methylproline demethylase [Leptolyngbya valderiana BDU 20041]
MTQAQPTSPAGGDPLLQPFRLRHLTLRNRIVSTSHEPNYAEDGLPTERYRLYHAEKAKGGIAMTMIGGSAVVAPDSPPAFGNLRLYDPAIVPLFRRLAEACHAHDTAVMCQITHLGRRSSNYAGDWLPLLAPSPIREAAHRAFPKAMEDWDIERVVADYAHGALACREGGLDGIEIEAYGHLLDAFWSPLTNRRDDAWGGSLDNRLRFAFQVLEAIREAVGTEFLVGIRMVLDEDTDGGLERGEGFEIARRLAASGLIDFVNAIKGHIDTDEGLSHVIPGMGTPAAPHLPLVADLKRQLGLPVLHAARINDVATARHAVASGALDLVGMTRAHMADPHIVAKVARGAEERVRPCVGVGYCIDSIYEGRPALCLHNPATGREAELPHEVAPAAEPRRAVVVGGGPGGLEAARVLALRGHAVTLFEAAEALGGQLRLASRLARRRDLIGIVDWLAAEAARAGAALHTGVYAEAETVLAEDPAIVVVATGGLPNTGFLGDGEAHATTTWDLLGGQVPPGQEVLVFDDGGSHAGVSAAEFAARAGAKVRFVTPERILAPEVGGTNYPAYFKAFGDYGVEIVLNRRLRAIRPAGNRLAAELWDEYARQSSEVTVDQVVVEHGVLPLDELYFALKPHAANLGAVDQTALLAGRPALPMRNPEGHFRLVRVGDAVASRNVHAALLDSLRLCREL